MVVARRKDRLDALVEQLPGAMAVPADLPERTSASTSSREALDAFGTVDILVNNAGLGNYLPIEDEDLD